MEFCECDAAKLRLAILQNDNHRRLVLYLLYVIKILCISLVVRDGPLSARLPYSQLLFNLGKAWPNQFPV